MAIASAWHVALGACLLACGATRHHEPEGDAESIPNQDSTLLCPSLEQAPESVLLVSRKGAERAVIRADGVVHLRHTQPFDYATEAYLGAGAELVFAAVESGFQADMTERRWQVARFDAQGGLLDTSQGTLPVASSPSARIQAPRIRLQGGSVALDQADGDTWLVGFDGTAQLLECAQHTPIGPSEERGFIGAWVRLRSGGPQGVFIDVQNGSCRRLTNVDSAGALFLRGRFQHLRADSGSLLLRDEGPSSMRDVPLWSEQAGARATLHAIADAVLYVLSAPQLARYDAVAQELRIISLPSAAASFSVHGDRLVGYEQGEPVWAYDLKGEAAIPVEERDRRPVASQPGAWLEADQVRAAVTLRANERYVVGFDQRSWPLFRFDTQTRSLASYAVTEPSDLVGFRDARYLEAPGDTLYEQHYASGLADAEVLEDGSVAVALRDARQGRLWLVTPEDNAFRPLGRPVTGVIGLDWQALPYSFQIAGDRGDCYCQPPQFRWEEGADADVLPSGSVQLVARAHPSLVIVRSDYLIEADASGVCVVEPAPVPLVHDLLAGTTRRLEGVDGEIHFLPESLLVQADGDALLE